MNLLKFIATIAVVLQGFFAFAGQAVTSTKVLAKGIKFPEGPAIDSKGNIWFSETKGGHICRLDKSGNLKRFAPEKIVPNGIAVDSLDRVWFCDVNNKRICVFYPTTGEIKKVCDEVGGKKLISPNDLAFDSKGNLIFTCPGNSVKSPTGYVCALNSKGAKKITEGKFYPNGVAFSADGKKLAIAETFKQRVWIGDWDAEKLEWSNPKILAEVGGTGPDGMAFGDDGNLYVAVYGGYAVKVISPKGEIVKEITFVGAKPTNCAFLPEGGLLITEATCGELRKFNTVTKTVLFFKKSWLP